MPDVIVDAPTGAEPKIETFEQFEAIKRGDVEQPAPTQEEGKTAEVTEASDEQEDGRERDEKGQFKSKKSDSDGVQKRIDKLTAQRREAERKAEALERQLEEYRAEKPAEVKTEAKKDSGDPEPSIDNFERYEDYVKAQARWEARQEIKADRERTAAEAQKQSQAERQKTTAQKWQESESAVREKYADYDDAIQEAAEDIKTGKLKALPDEAFAAIMESDSKAELFYHLAKNRADLERLAGAPTERTMLIELGKIEAKLAAPPVQETKPKASLPKPPATVGGTAKGGSLSDAQTFEDYERIRNAQKRRR